MRWFCSLFLLVSTGIAQTQVGCTVYQTGKFKYLSEPFEDISFKRTKNRQTEKNSYTGITNQFKVKWISNCEYELTFLGSNKQDLVKYKPGWIIKIKIDAAYEDMYDFTMNVNGIIYHGSAGFDKPQNTGLDGMDQDPDIQQDIKDKNKDKGGDNPAPVPNENPEPNKDKEKKNKEKQLKEPKSKKENKKKDKTEGTINLTCSSQW